MDGSDRAKLILALGQKNKVLRLSISQKLSRSLHSVVDDDPDYNPTDDEEVDSDSEEGCTPSGRKEDSEHTEDEDQAAVVDEVVKSVGAGEKKKPQKKASNKVTATILKAVESDEQIVSAVGDLMGHLLESVCDGKEYNFDTVDDSATYTKKGKPRKRKKCEEPPVVRKRKKCELMMQSHKVLPPCPSTCKLKCPDLVDGRRRQAINNEFWGLSKEDRKAYIMKSQRKTPKGRSTVSNHNGQSRRENTFQYVFTDDDGNDVVVCKVFFLATLGYHGSSDSILKGPRASINSGRVMPLPDKRGHHPNKNKVDREPIISHIMSFKPSISHYRRDHAPNRLYLPSDINIKLMHNLFKQSHPDMAETVSYELYRLEVSKLNISFTKLGHEECFECEVFTLHCSSQEGHSKDQLVEDCEPCKTWGTHHEQYKKARIEYQNDVNKPCSPDRLIVSADLQKVIMLPRADMFKEVIFIPRIIAFNESFVPVGSPSQNGKDSNAKPMAVIWHEGISGRKKGDIISTFYAFLLKNRDMKHITIWLDNCAAQNKNWALFSFFIYMVNGCDDVSLEVLEIKYFESGHTFMSADAFHHQVELSMSKNPKIFDFNDFSNAVQAANSSNTYVHEMKVADFFADVKDFKSTAKLNKLQPKPLLPDFVSVLFVKGKNCLQFKNDYHDQYQELNYLTANAYKNGVQKPEPKTNARGIDMVRKLNLISKLKPIIPPNRLQFWENLPVSDTPQPLDDQPV